MGKSSVVEGRRVRPPMCLNLKEIQAKALDGAELLELRSQSICSWRCLERFSLAIRPSPQVFGGKVSKS